MAKIDAMDAPTFRSELGFAFELSPWVVERAHAAGPFGCIDVLHDAMMRVLGAAPVDDRVGLIRAHPDLAGKAALAGELTRESVDEQKSAGLDRLEPDEFATINKLNDAYRAQFAFPFVICAKLNDKHAILAAMERRLNNSREHEIDEAVRQIGLISRLRLDEAITL